MANKNTINILILILSYIGAQRFTLPVISSVICLLPFILSIVYVNNKKKSLTFLIMALFLSVDNGALAYRETDFFIRYIIYLFALYILLSDLKIKKSKLALISSIFVWYLFLTVSERDPIDLGVLKSGFVMFFLFVISTSKRLTLHNRLEVDDAQLSIFFVTYIFAEVVNMLFFFDKGIDYLSYDSSKSLIIFPAIYLLYKRSLSCIFILPMTIFVLIGYTTRMVLLGFCLIILLYAVRLLFNNKKTLMYIFILMVPMYIIGVDIVLGSDLEGHKATNMISVLLKNDTLFSFFENLDKGRFYENKLFFSQSLFDLSFGSGFGTGLYDRDNLLGFIGYSDTAFTVKEIDSKLFYNLHDVWTDVGIRFGILPIIIGCVILGKNVLSKNDKSSFYSSIIILLILCQFFTTSGLLMTALFIVCLRSENVKYKKVFINAN